MKEKNFISRADDENDGAKVNAIDANKTLMIDQYTSDVSLGDPELFEHAKDINEVFEHFKPSVDVDFVNKNGETICETLHFHEMNDFNVDGGKGNLVSNSAFLSEIKMQADNTSKIRKQIEVNNKLRSILKDSDAKEELKMMLKNMLDELEK